MMRKYNAFKILQNSYYNMVVAMPKESYQSKPFSVNLVLEPTKTLNMAIIPVKTKVSTI
ncbi:hypothetical protein SAMN02583745_01701 [Thorsellia anophelis DSM 18579]|uniref:Uncharacterized protein n=1 Tax=Thorsellia anophelis DSM 18579 TaxID=1123402 RepID=A0A1I0CNN6_9GAMM|nr:hypothetical protein SAMN02583745_01701 [Thorsellia anophelis DSM 18579]